MIQIKKPWPYAVGGGSMLQSYLCLISLTASGDSHFSLFGLGCFQCRRGIDISDVEVGYDAWVNYRTSSKSLK
ncbi:hypothetical protein M378DRAFT_761337 [Amanita muscaria Koide BX008]|uniref:Uncharacterized protein n=1 Tax=Amanita muscaria (strain Koide BX008) TaxID=946122 RepID=A0A0C2SHC0_AMAMK|nr:hypothetical protein M378DRAFT_761337 [Amanita muscaria Koide BX008]